MSVDPNYSNRTFQLVSVKTEIVPSHSVLPSRNLALCKSKEARAISFQGFLKLKEKERLLPTFETSQS